MLFVRYVTHSFNLWFSLSVTLQVLHNEFMDPLKLLPHCSIPNRAVMIVFVSCFVHSISSFSVCLVYAGLFIFSMMCAVLVLGVDTLPVIL